MGLRDLASGMARTTSGVWTGIAEAIDGPTRPPSSAAAPPRSGPTTEPGAGTVVGDATPTDGAMLVPLDTWTRILEQVGHVHEAGQQVAEARERAARAETENRFLKEQLAELRKPSGVRRTVRRTEPAAEATVDLTTSAPAGGGEGRLTRARRAAGGWLSQ